MADGWRESNAGGSVGREPKLVGESDFTGLDAKGGVGLGLRRSTTALVSVSSGVVVCK